MVCRSVFWASDGDFESKNVQFLKMKKERNSGQKGEYFQNNINVKNCSGQGGGERIMDLDQYLEKMITNTKIIWIQKEGYLC